MYYDPKRPTCRYRHILPHWDQPGTWVFITWRLADALPASRLRVLREEKNRWQLEHPKPWTEKTEVEYHALFSRRVDHWLDQGAGSCCLRRPDLSRHLEDILRFDVGRHMDLECVAVMPNHVHLLVCIRENRALQRCIRTWKSISARRINLDLNRQGTLWQEGYFDRLIRSERHWFRVRRYILENPAQASLKKGYRLVYRDEENPGELVLETCRSDREQAVDPL